MLACPNGVQRASMAVLFSWFGVVERRAYEEAAMAASHLDRNDS